MRALAPVYTTPFDFFTNFEKELSGIFNTGKDNFGERRFESREREDAWLMAFDLPGVESQDLSVEYEEGALRIEGKRKPFFDEGEGAKFSRVFRLPKSVDPEKIEAKLENGVLTVTLPKQEKERPKKISVNIQ